MDHDTSPFVDSSLDCSLRYGDLAWVMTGRAAQDFSKLCVVGNKVLVASSSPIAYYIGSRMSIKAVFFNRGNQVTGLKA